MLCFLWPGLTKVSLPYMYIGQITQVLYTLTFHFDENPFQLEYGKYS